jgi:hypothetical protein
MRAVARRALTRLFGYYLHTAATAGADAPEMAAQQPGRVEHIVCR